MTLIIKTEKFYVGLLAGEFVVPIVEIKRTVLIAIREKNVIKPWKKFAKH